jgi:hypothetical protein
MRRDIFFKMWHFFKTLKLGLVFQVSQPGLHQGQPYQHRLHVRTLARSLSHMSGGLMVAPLFRRRSSISSKEGQLDP